MAVAPSAGGSATRSSTTPPTTSPQVLSHLAPFRFQLTRFIVVTKTPTQFLACRRQPDWERREQQGVQGQPRLRAARGDQAVQGVGAGVQGLPPGGGHHHQAAAPPDRPLDRRLRGRPQPHLRLQLPPQGQPRGQPTRYHQHMSDSYIFSCVHVKSPRNPIRLSTVDLLLRNREFCRQRFVQETSFFSGNGNGSRSEQLRGVGAVEFFTLTSDCCCGLQEKGQSRRCHGRTGTRRRWGSRRP